MMLKDTMEIRYDWTVDQVLALLSGPLDDLLGKARILHLKHAGQDIQKCELLSIKTGGCADDCGYCSQSAHHQTCISPEPLMETAPVIEAAKRAKENGASRFCMGASWKRVPSGKQFNRLLDIIRGVAACGIEACGTFGSPTKEQLRAMKEAGLTSYNHNLDTGRDYYPQVVTTRTYNQRLEALKLIRESGIQICCGGILGMGEGLKDRASLLCELASLSPHPESVPINLLVPIQGTPMEDAKPIPFEDFLRMVAVARIMMPSSRLRLSAGRNMLSENEQRQCFEVGANSIFIGEKLLTTPNIPQESDINI